MLCTSDDTISPEDVLLEVEDAFRTLKTTLELRPMHQRLEDRIRSHVLFYWLVLLLIRQAIVLGAQQRFGMVNLLNQAGPVPMECLFCNNI